MNDRLAHRVVRSSQATPAAVDKSQRLEHENSDSPPPSPALSPIANAAGPSNLDFLGPHFRGRSSGAQLCVSGPVDTQLLIRLSRIFDRLHQGWTPNSDKYVAQLQAEFQDH